MKNKNAGKNSEAPHCRENYEAHTHKFLDWAEGLGIERTYARRFLVFFEQKLQIQRFMYIFLFCLALSYALMFEIRAPLNFKSGEMADRDVSSPITFEMTDKVTTEEKRVKAEMAVPVIMDYDPMVFDRVSGSVYRAFRVMRSKMKNVKWSKSVYDNEEKIKEFFIYKGEFEKELGASVSDFLFEWLVANRFSARYENVVIRNLFEWYQNKIIENIERTVPQNQSVVLAKVLDQKNQGREFSIRRTDLVELSSTESFVLKEKKGLERSTSTDRANVLALARLLVYPNLTLNKQEMASRRDLARQNVLPITVSIKKNQTIINEGTVIQPFHMAMLEEIQQLRSLRRHEIKAFSLALVFVCLILVFFQYLKRFSSRNLKLENKDILVMSLIALSVVMITKFFVFTTETSILSSFGHIVPSSVFLYAAPLAAGPMLVGLLISSGEIVWLFTAFMSIALGFMVELNFPFMIITFVSGIAGARGVLNCKKRNDIYWAGLRVGLINMIMAALMLVVFRVEQEGILREAIASGIAGFMGGIFSALVAMSIIPVLESIFNYTTDIKLLELSNLNHPLLKEMIVKAPGTYHHSMLVGSMVEAAAEEIGANPLLAKVMSYYHDIGKMEHANYFIENQKPGQNPHDHISPYMSKTLLIAHVKDGVELGMTHMLGKPIIDGVIQHHGTTLISYFFNKALDNREEGDAEVLEDEFRYPGPKPQFPEAALCMLADSIEAAARSLDEPTPVRLQNIVRNIVQRKFMEAQLDDCSLNLKDLSKIEGAFTRILLGIYHQRIDYPRSAGGGTSEAPSRPLFSVPSGTAQKTST